mgnify:CR=1 FL=1
MPLDLSPILVNGLSSLSQRKESIASLAYEITTMCGELVERVINFVTGGGSCEHTVPEGDFVDNRSCDHIRHGDVSRKDTVSLVGTSCVVFPIDEFYLIAYFKHFSNLSGAACPVHVSNITRQPESYTFSIQYALCRDTFPPGQSTSTGVTLVSVWMLTTTPTPGKIEHCCRR